MIPYENVQRDDSGRPIARGRTMVLSPGSSWRVRDAAHRVGFWRGFWRYWEPRLPVGIARACPWDAW